MHKDELKKVFKNKKHKIDKKGNTIQGFEKTTWEEFLGWFNEVV